MNLINFILISYGIVCLLNSKFATCTLAAAVGVLCMLLIPGELDGSIKFSIVLILAMFSIWNYVSQSCSNLERANSVFTVLGAIFGVSAQDVLAVILSASLMTVCSVGILLHGFDWRNYQKLAQNYLLLSAISIMTMIVSLAFLEDLSLRSLKDSSKAAQGLLIIGLLSKLGVPLVNPSGLPLYSVTIQGYRLAFWSSVFKFYLSLTFLNLMSNLDQEIWLTVSVGLLSMFLGAALMARSEGIRNFLGSSSAFTLGVLALVSSFTEPENLTLYLFIYSTATLAALRALNSEGQPAYPWIVGNALLVAGGVAPVALMLFLKIIILNQLEIPLTALVGSSLALLGSSYFYAKHSAVIFGLNTEKMPRQLASLTLITLAISIFAFVAPGIFLR